MSCRIFTGNLVIPKPGSQMRLTGDESKYVARVLRLREGDSLILSSADGVECVSTISAVEKKSVLLTIDSVEKPERESKLHITLCQSLPKSKKMDLIVQKCTELGVSRFVPFLSSRSVSRPDRRESAEKKGRWEKIALEAARQCGRTFIPPVDGIADFDELIESFSNSDDKKTLKLIPWECEDEKGLKELAGEEVERVVLLIGPEGGFSDEEVEKARKNGFIPLSLGPRLLRTETAGFSTVSIVQYIWGDMN